ncbi:MAG: hypothetical protein HUJ69_05200 [Lachnospiraceae bacterium]|nr:hypothetical protein [Lachnospiraceae bacterium]
MRSQPQSGSQPFRPQNPKDQRKPGHRQNHRPKESLKDSYFVLIPYLCFVIITTFAWIPSLRPSYSDSEGRDLLTFPDFSMASLTDGTYFEGISLWFSDTFPGRESWVFSYTRISQMYGIRDTVIEGPQMVADEIPDTPQQPSKVDLDALVETLRDKDQTLAAGTDSGPAENTESSAEISAENSEEAGNSEDVSEMDSNRESTETADGEPDLKDGLNVDLADAMDFGAVMVLNNAAYEFYGFSLEATSRYGSIVAYAAEKFEDTSRVFSIIVPNSTGIILSEEMYAQLDSSDEEAGINYAYSCMGEKVYSVETYRTLRSHNTENIFFRTDHHWTALGAYYVYRQWAETAGFEPVELSEFELLDNGDFLGSFYRNYDMPAAMENDPDRIICYVPRDDISMWITSGEGNVTEYPLVLDYSGSDTPFHKYSCFIAGDNYKTEIINDSIQDDSTCLLYKDSYGNPFAVFLTQHYHRVIVIDDRFIFNLDDMVETYGIDDIIFLSALTLSQSSATFENYCYSIY